jgi:hypothetical protein
MAAKRAMDPTAHLDVSHAADARVREQGNAIGGLEATFTPVLSERVGFCRSMI